MIYSRRRREHIRHTKVVLCAATIDSAKIALQSNLSDPNGKIGKGITDHTIMFCHFVIPDRGVASPGKESAKFLITNSAATEGLHDIDIVVELSAQFNQGRYVDADHLSQDQALAAEGMLCEIVFQFYAPLKDSNAVATAGTDPGNSVQVFMTAVDPPAAVVREAQAITHAVFVEFGATAVTGKPGLVTGGTVNLTTANIGGVAHEVGTL